MKSTSENATFLKSHLTLIKSGFAKKKTENINRIYINTLIPGFNYTNQLGELITPKKCILL
jgi:hypothetical protein